MILMIKPVMMTMLVTVTYLNNSERTKQPNVDSSHNNTMEEHKTGDQWSDADLRTLPLSQSDKTWFTSHKICSLKTEKHTHILAEIKPLTYIYNSSSSRTSSSRSKSSSSSHSLTSSSAISSNNNYCYCNSYSSSCNTKTTT